MAQNKTVYEVVLDENGIAVLKQLGDIANKVNDAFSSLTVETNDLKQNLTDLSSTVCEMEGTLRSGLMNDIGVADEEVKNFNLTLLNADEDFKKFLAKIAGFKIDGAKEESGLDKVNKWLDLIDHVTGIGSNVLGIYGGVKSLMGEGSTIEEVENVNDFGKNIYGHADDLSANTASTLEVETGADATAVETGETLVAEGGTEALGAAGLVEESAELGALFGPEGILAGAVVGLVLYGIDKALSSEPGGGLENSSLATDSSEYNRQTNDYKDAIPTLKFDESLDEKEFAKLHEHAPSLVPYNEYVKTYSKKQDEEYGKYLAKEDAGTAYLPGGYGGGLSKSEYFADKSKIVTNEPAEATVAGGAIPYSSDYTGAPMFETAPMSSASLHHLSQDNIEGSAVSRSKNGGGNTFNMNNNFNDTHNNRSAISPNDVHDMVVRVLTEAVSDSKIGTDIH
jgi:hypothetical protein